MSQGADFSFAAQFATCQLQLAVLFLVSSNFLSLLGSIFVVFVCQQSLSSKSKVFSVVWLSFVLVVVFVFALVVVVVVRVLECFRARKTKQNKIYSFQTKTKSKTCVQTSRVANLKTKLKVFQVLFVLNL